MTKSKDRQILRELAKKWIEIANLPAMDERKVQWKALNDLNAIKPMILVETWYIQDYVYEAELQCEDIFFRNVEKTMRWIIRHFEEIGDDIVVEPYFRLPWEVSQPDYGVSIELISGQVNNVETVGFTYNFPIKTSEDISKLKHNTRHVYRKKTEMEKEVLEDMMGDILTIKTGGNDPFHFDSGFRPWVGNNFFGLTWELLKLIGNNKILTWVYDEPDAIHRLMSFLRDDRIAQFKWMEKEKLLELNTDNQFAGAGRYGYVLELPQADYNGVVRTKDLWGWAESQETGTPILSPGMFAEFVLPYIADLSKMFGLIYYGCCEGLHDRWELISKGIPNIRSVSISGWSDFKKMGEFLGEKYVYSRKPIPTYISGNGQNWEALRKDVIKTLEAVKGNNFEFIFRDIYTINGDRPRLKRWVDMVYSLLNS